MIRHDVLLVIDTSLSYRGNFKSNNKKLLANFTIAQRLYVVKESRYLLIDVNCKLLDEGLIPNHFYGSISKIETGFSSVPLQVSE
ncbi:MAG: hypothetical protein JXA42_06945 [Anaerolineales bacterium]|nr:hypothetical protein [Anaerolineales bacterium]